MLEGIPWPAVGAAGLGWLLFGIAGAAIIRGRLIPRSTYDDVLHDRNEWRAESRIKDAQIVEKDEQLRHLREVGENVTALTTKLSEIAEHEARP